jgi:hypothetical protein
MLFASSRFLRYIRNLYQTPFCSSQAGNTKTHHASKQGSQSTPYEYTLVISRDRQTAEKPKKPKSYPPLLVYPEVRYFFVLIPKEFKNEFLKAEKAEKAFFYFKSRFLKK